MAAAQESTGPITQDGRMMSIYTPLGKDFLLINRLSASEGLSELFTINVELLHEEAELGHSPTIVNPQSLVGKVVAIGIQQPDGTERYFNGIINKFTQGNRDDRFSYYYASIVPHVWLLTQIAQSRIFQQISVPDILKRIFANFEVTYELQSTYHPRNYCVQYRETDFDFVSRLMEEEGIYYYFQHTDNSHKLIIADTPQSHRDCPSKKEIPFFYEVPDDDWVSAISTWQADYNLKTGKVTLWDESFQLPNRNLEANQSAAIILGDNKQLEVYDFPGGYAKKYDGIDKSGGEQTGELNKIFEENTKIARVRMQEIEAQYNSFTGISDCCSITAGHRFKLTTHPNSNFNVQHTLTSVTHNIQQSPDYVSEEKTPNAYENSFTCITHGGSNPPFRPIRKTPKPIVHGSQTAVVVGPAGEEIFTDKYGRVKVQFRWDRYGQADAGSSCWVRVKQAWAGNKWGTIFIPRIGMEVVVEFMEGDPDQPIITGCVYDAAAMPPYTLPDEKTKSTIKSNSSKGGGGFNEIRFEDKKGSEQIFIHGQKNLDIRVLNDELKYLVHDSHLIIKNDQYEKVEKDKHMQVGGDKSEKVTGSVSLSVGADIDEKAGAKYALDAGNEIHLKSGTSMTLETGTNLTLKVGGNFISINSSGVFIKGNMVMLNSGGGAGSGSGSNPDAPKDPKEADKAEPGTRTPTPQPAAPPPNPQFKSAATVALINAAKSGTPFCEICSRAPQQNQTA